MKTAKINGIAVAACGLCDLKEWNDAGITHVISIWGGLDTNDSQVLRQLRDIFPHATVYPCFFNDVTDADASYPPTEKTVRGILDFTATLRAGDLLLVQCSAGVSRSSAIAFSVLCQHWGQGFELECYVELKWMRPLARPNMLIVELADTLLGRSGKMVKVIE